MGYGNLQQPPPIPNNGPACWDLVIADVENGLACEESSDFAGWDRVHDLVLAEMRERHALGKAKYEGVYLQPANGRDALADWYQEALDGAVYARQAVHEYDARDMRIPGANHDLVRVRQAYQKQLALVFTIREMIADRDEARAAKSDT